MDPAARGTHAVRSGRTVGDDMATRAHRHIWALIITAVLGTGLATLAAPVVAAPVSATPATPTPVQVAAGYTHSCARMADGSVYCWGWNGYGQLGYGHTDDIGDDETPGSAGPVDLGAGRTATDITVGNGYTCAVLDDGTVRCWGYGAAGSLGYGNTDFIGDDETPGSVGPVDLGAGRTATAITAGSGHTCALLDDGTVLCWGNNTDGRLGYGNTDRVGDDETPGSVGPVDLGAGRTATALATGWQHTCALLDDGTVRCWGDGFVGALGYGNTDVIGDDETPGSVGTVNLGAGRTATQIDASTYHTCATLDDGTVRCWGIGRSGELGYGNTATIGDNETPGSVGPVDLGAGRTATVVTAGESHTCALLDDSTVRCWGSNPFGDLGYGNTDSIGDDETPGSVGAVNLGPGRTATAVSAGSHDTCAILDDGTLRCWGYNGSGQLGYANLDNIGDDESPGSAGPVDFSPPPVRATLTADESSVFIGTTIHYHLTVENLTDAPLTGITAEVGDEDQDEIVPDCGQPASELGAGAEQTVDCTYTVTEDDEGRTLMTRARLTANELSSSFRSNSVQREVREFPIDFEISTEQTSVTAGDDITYYVYVENRSPDDTLTGITIDDPDAPDCSREMPDLDPENSDYYACTYTTTLDDVGLYSNTGTMTADGFPDPIAAVADAVRVRDPNAVPIGATAVAAGSEHSCAILDGGAVKCWGSNDSGQLGLGLSPDDLELVSDPSSFESVDLGVGRTATAIDAGAYHTCALLDDGSVECWGANDDGQLGYGNTDYIGDDEAPASAGPVDLGGGRTATAISTGAFHTCALLDDSTVKCWGTNYDGQLGYGNSDTIGDDETPAGIQPVDLGAGRTATAISAGGSHTCAILDDSTVRCWGTGRDGALGYGNTDNVGDDEAPGSAGPVDLGDGHTATAISAGGSHTCAVLDDGTVRCWGYGEQGQLGYGNTDRIGDDEAPGSVGPVDLGDDSTATAVSAGSEHTCVILDDGLVRCWGADVSADDGSDTIGDDETPAAVDPLDFGAGRTTTVVSAGDGYTCGLLDDASIRCWGRGDSGQLGNATEDDYFDDLADLGPVIVGYAEAGPAALTLSMTADETTVPWGEAIHYHLTARNVSSDQLTELTVADPNATDCERPVEALEPGQEVTIDCLYVPTPADVGTYTNVATIDSADSSPATSNEVDVTVTQGGPPAPSMKLIASSGSAFVAPGQTILYLYLVRNTGNITLHNIDLSDPTTPDCGDDAVFDLPAGRSKTISCTYTATGNDSGTRVERFTAVADEIPTPVTSSQVSVRVGASAFVEMTTEQTTVAVGETITYHVVVTSVSALDLTGLLATATVSPYCEHGPFSLAVHEGLSFDCEYRPTAADLGTHTNRLTVDSPDIVAATSEAVAVEVTIPDGYALMSGTVTETGTGAPIAGALVAPLSLVDYSPVAVGTTDASGDYVALAPVGTYFVYVIDPSLDHTAAFAGAPSTVTVSSGATTDADAHLVPTRGTIAGTVTDTGGPLAGVMAMSVDLDAGEPAAGDLTDANGHYAITGINAGNRLVELIDLSGTHSPEFYDDVPTPAGATVLPVTGANVTTADAALAPQAPPGSGAHLVGRITSSAGGDLEGVAVMAVHSGDFSFAAGDLTDASGHYDIAVDAGTYKLAFYDPTAGHSFEWHDNQTAAGLGSAANVTATAGSPLTVDAALTPTTGTVSGTVTEAGSGDNLANGFVVAIDSQTNVVGGTTTNGIYTISGLPAGNIRLRFVDLTGAHTSEYYDNSPDYDHANPLASTPGAVLTDINAALSP